jgi:hypothetical protein
MLCNTEDLNILTDWSLENVWIKLMTKGGLNCPTQVGPNIVMNQPVEKGGIKLPQQSETLYNPPNCGKW